VQAKKYQVFVSSTYSDLIEERREVIEAIIDLGHIPAGMEGFPAIDMEQFNYIKKVIDQCDYYIIVVAGRYGSIAEDGTSFTEKEYRYAVDSGKTVIGFVIDEQLAQMLPADKMETDPSAQDRLASFRTEVMKGRLIRSYTDRNSLARSVMKALVAAFEEFPKEGWVRASAVASDEILAQLNELRLENDLLSKEIKNLQALNAPDIEGLAPLDQLYKIEYTYFGGNPARRRPGDVSLSWRMIFFAVAPHIPIPRASQLFSQYVKQYLKDAGFISYDISINSISENQMRVHLSALGLIRLFTALSTEETKMEWIEITPRGTRLWVESQVVRKT
jgi:hypothetical protein